MGDPPALDLLNSAELTHNVFDRETVSTVQKLKRVVSDSLENMAHLNLIGHSGIHPPTQQEEFLNIRQIRPGLCEGGGCMLFLGQLTSRKALKGESCKAPTT